MGEPYTSLPRLRDEPMSLWQDVRFGARALVKDRWVTLAAATALALGIGANSMVFTLVNAVLLRGLPFHDPDRIMAVGMRDARGRQLGVSLPDFEDWKRASRTFSGLVGIYGAAFNVSDEGRAPEQFTGTYISTNVFELIGQQPMLGRNFAPDDDRLNAPPIVMLGNGLWKRRYGGDAALRRACVQLMIGLVIGLAGAVGVGKLLQTIPFLGTSSTDLTTLTTIVAVLISVAVAACFWPARRATRLDPVLALRYE
jgi:hypothetical protein